MPTIEDVPSPRAIRIMSFGELNLEVHKKLGRAFYMLKTDIAQFYPSIYTHSIPWAIHTKALCKKDRTSGSKTCFFNELDYHLRNCQDAQTRGLFIGPDAARLISETILVDIDKRIQETSAKHIRGAVRYVDDYFIGTETEGDAALVLSAISDALDEYELIPNDVKTKIIATSKPTDDLWPLQLIRAAGECFNGGVLSQAHVKELFDTSLTLTSDTGLQSPVKLLLRQLDKYNDEAEGQFKFIEPYLLRFIHHFPHAIDYICMIVGARVLRGDPIASDDWKIVIGNEIGRFIKLGQHQEVAWLLWLAIVGNLNLDDALLDSVLGRENAHLSAMIISAVRTGDLKNKITLTLPDTADLRSEDWLMLHEATLAGMSKLILENDEMDLHSQLLKSDFSFVDYSLVYGQVGAGSVIGNIKFGYEDDDELPPDAAGVFAASSQDF